MSFNKINLRKKFLLLSSLIMVVFALFLSTVFYAYMKKIVVQDALEKSAIILQEVEAIREYVKQELRPRMYKLHDSEGFILEAMSTTYVSIRIMKLFHEKMEGYTYRRVSQNPLNPENATNGWEDQMFDWFEADEERSLWQGQVDGETTSSFISVIPDYTEKECLNCHGDPADAPGSLIEKYGGAGGFRFVEGDLAGLNSVSIPISKPQSRLATLTFVIFLLTLGGTLLLLLVVNILFDKLVLARLAGIVDSLHDDQKTFIQESQPTPESTADELDTLQSSFHHLNSYVRTARRGDNLQPGFIGPYVIAEPLATGVMSWLYRGHHSETSEEVMLKIPFNNLYVNPLYRACLQAELKLFQHCEHRNLLRVKDRIEDIMIFDTRQGSGGMTPWVPPNIGDPVLFFLELFELVAYLHTNDIVHHDLRPDILFMTGAGTPVIADLGIAHWRKLPDTIFESGVVPQGDFRFMGPEQIKGLRGDPRSDLYSLGVLLFFVYTGTFPHMGKPTSRQSWLTAKKRVQKNVARQAQLPGKLLHLLEKALAYDLKERYQWVEDMRDDLIAATGDDSRAAQR